MIANPAAIPEELRARRQWVCWRLQERDDGKPTKVPYQPWGWKLAEADNPETWGTYEQALDCKARHNHSGVGYVFAADDPFTGIDLDKCRDPETGELEEWAQQIVAGLAPCSYIEASPSGTGVHIITRAALPPGRRRTGRVEMYDRERFFTITGQRIGGEA